LLSIRPRAEAAAVWIIEFIFLLFTSDIIAKTVIGLIIPEAADETGKSSSTTKIKLVGTTIKFAHPPPLK
jgi:hypothetical protein